MLPPACNDRVFEADRHAVLLKHRELPAEHGDKRAIVIEVDQGDEFAIGPPLAAIRRNGVDVQWLVAVVDEADHLRWVERRSGAPALTDIVLVFKAIGDRAVETASLNRRHKDVPT